MPTILEFWPEYSHGPLWSTDGTAIDPTLLGVSSDLSERLRDWNSRYDDSKLPFEANDTVWLAEGKSLLSEVRAVLGSDYDVVVTEPWWGETPRP